MLGAGVPTPPDRAGQQADQEQATPPVLAPDSGLPSEWETYANPAAVPAPSDLSVWEQAAQEQDTLTQSDSPLVPAALERGAATSDDRAGTELSPAQRVRERIGGDPSN